MSFLQATLRHHLETMVVHSIQESQILLGEVLNIEIHPECNIPLTRDKGKKKNGQINEKANKVLKVKLN